MRTVREIIEKIEELAPTYLAEPWDNVGLMVGNFEQRVTTVFVCLDVTSDNVKKAIECGADLIISHHPLIFSPVKRIVEQDISGGILRNLIKNDISVYSAHTNLDNADGGTNDELAKRINLVNVRRFYDEECVDSAGKSLDNIGRVGKLEEPMKMGDFVCMVEEALCCKSIRFVGDAEDVVRNVALCSGSGGEGIYSAYNSGADVYVTSDIKHHEAQLAFELGINLIDAGHFETENTICSFMSEYIENNFDDINVIPSDAQPYFK